MKRERSDRMNTLGRNIRRHRLAKGLDCCELARLTGVTPMSISYYERGLRTPRVENISKIAAALGVTVTDLLEDGDRKAV